MRLAIRGSSGLVLGLSLFLLSCGGSDGPTGPDPDAVATVTVSPGTLALEIGGTGQLSAQALNSQGGTVSTTVSWSSSATDVATVSNSGSVSAVGEGSATITASTGGRSGAAAVTVTDPSPPAAPSDLQGGAESNVSVTLTWTDGSDNEDGFEIEREPATPGVGAGQAALRFQSVGTVGADVTTFTDEGLAPNTAYRYRVRATNVNGASAYTAPVEVTTFSTLSVGTEALAVATLDQPYEQTLAAVGGDGSFTWSLLSGELPPGISFSEEGVVSGTPTDTGSFAVEVQVTGGGQTATASLTLTVVEELVAPTVVSDTLPGAALGASYTTVLEARGGDGIYTWSVLSGSFQAGLDLAADGTLSGTPTVEGTVTVTVQVTSAELTGSGSVTLTVTSAPLSVTTTSLPEGQVGSDYAATLQSEGGASPVTWSVVSGTLPDGLALDPGSGRLTGIPSVSGTSVFTVEASSADGQSDTAALSLTVDPGPVSVETVTVASGQVGAAYSVSLSAGGGDGRSYSWSLFGGTLPTGISLTSGGVLTGTPSSVQDRDFTVRVTSAGMTATRMLRLTIRPLPQPGYQVQLVYLTSISPTHRAAFESAQARWQGLITGDEPDETGGLPACFDFHPATEGTVDDVVIYVKVDSIDGPNGTLGQAGPCYLRDASLLTLSGGMTFDEEDLDQLAANGVLEEVILHEMGHVLGIGTLWENQGLRSGECLDDPIFTGPRAIAAFNEADGTLYSGEPVPVENSGSLDDGSNCGHWREDVLGPELMTPFLQLGDNPLSAITVESLGDQGYTVDLSGADSYVLPKPVPVGRQRVIRGVRMMNDLYRGPRFRVDRAGRIRRVGGGR